MDKRKELEAVSTLVENELVRNLKSIREGSYGILSSTVKEREVKKFKERSLKKEHFTALSDEEINIIIEYILLKSGIEVNEVKLRTPDLEER